MFGDVKKNTSPKKVLIVKGHKKNISPKKVVKGNIKKDTSPNKVLVGDVKKDTSPNKVLVVVNGNVITQLDIENRIKVFSKLSNVKIPESERKTIFANMLKVSIDELLKLQKVNEFIHKFNDNKPLVTRKDMDEYLDNVLKQNRMQRIEFEKFIKDNEINMDFIYRQIDANLSWVRFISGCFGGNIQISDAEVTSFLNQFEARNKGKTYVMGRIIVPFSKTTEKEAKAKIDEAKYYLSKGVAFELVANNFSSGPEAQSGGFVGALKEAQFSENEFEVIKTLKIGEVSQVIRNNDDFVIFKIYNIKDKAGNLTKITAQRIEYAVLRQDLEAVAEEVLANAQNIDSFLLAASLDKRAKILNDEEFIVENMHPEFQGMMATLKPGTISVPVPTPNGFMVFYVKKKEIVQGEIPSFEEAKLIIQNKKLESIAKKQFQEIQANAYIKYMN